MVDLLVFPVQFNKVIDPKHPLNKSTGAILTPRSPPAPMPIPAALLRRKKEIIDESPALSQEEETVVTAAKIPPRESAPGFISNVNSKPVPTTKPSLPTKYESPTLTNDLSLVREGPPLISRKLTRPSPSPSSLSEDNKRASASNNITPPTDTKETIGKRISLKERMAIFQGNDGSGQTNLPPKPATNKPMWKPPPKPVSSPSLAEDKPPTNIRTVLSSPLLEIESTETPAKKPTGFVEQEDARTELNKDPEDEGRRGAVITTRTERLGGVKIGGAPPVVAPKPHIRQHSVPKVEETKLGTYRIQ